jgi:hypothetical protein
MVFAKYCQSLDLGWIASLRFASRRQATGGNRRAVVVGYAVLQCSKSHCQSSLGGPRLGPWPRRAGAPAAEGDDALMGRGCVDVIATGSARQASTAKRRGR